jgi:hypothetical protein
MMHISAKVFVEKAIIPLFFKLVFVPENSASFGFCFIGNKRFKRLHQEISIVL